MMFLRDQFVPRATKSNLTSLNTFTLNESDTEKGDDEEETEIFFDEVRSPADVVPISPAPSSATSAEIKAKRKRTLRDGIGDALLQIEEKKLAVLQQDVNQTSNPDMKFLESLLPHMEHLPKNRKILLQMKLPETVYNFVYGTDQPQ